MEVDERFWGKRSSFVIRLVVVGVCSVEILRRFLPAEPADELTARSNDLDPRSSRRMLQSTSEEELILPLETKTVTTPIYSSAHCVGENFAPDAYKYRSCQFRNLCFDTVEKEFALFQSEEERQLEQFLVEQSDPWVTISSTLSNSVTLGGSKWFPSTRQQQLTESHSVVKSDKPLVVVPFSFSEALVSFAEASDAQALQLAVVWGTMLPIVTLLHMFGLEDHKLLLIQHDPVSDSGAQDGLSHVLRAYQSALGMKSSDLTVRSALVVDSGGPVNLICFPNGAAGLTMMKYQDEPEATHSVGQSASLWTFRNFMIRNLDLPPQERPPEEPWHVTFAFWNEVEASLFARQVMTARDIIANDNSVRVQVLHLEDLDLATRAKSVTQSSVLVASSMVTMSTFLPRGASLIAYITDAQEDTAFPKLGYNNWWPLRTAGFFRAHCIELRKRDSPDALQRLESAIKRKLSQLRCERDQA